MTKPAPKQDDPAQSKRFIKMAKDLGLEEGEDIDGAVKRLAALGRPKPRPKQGKAAKPGKKRSA